MSQPLDERLRALAATWAPKVGGGVCAVTVGTTEVVAPFGHLHVDGALVDAPADARFYLTSVSKPVVGMQVMALVDDGLLDLDAPVADYLPAFAVNGKSAVTTRHLLTHTSGCDQAANVIEGPPTKLGPADFLEIAMRAELVQPPGRSFAYCSPPWWVLAELILRLTGETHIDHFAHRVLAGLGPTGLAYHLGERPPPRTVTPSSAPDRRHIVETVRRAAYPAGGLMGSAADLLAVGRCMVAEGAGAAGRVLSSRATRLMTTPTTTGTVGGRDVTWGLGWEVGGPGSLRAARTAYHGGASGVAMWVDLELAATVVLLTGTFGVSRRTFAEAINGVVALLS